MATRVMNRERSFDIKKIIQDRGLKATHQRIAVYQAMYELGHASADMVIEHVLKVFPTLTVATVYNILESFASVGLIRRLPSSETKMYFDISTDDHIHIFCEDSQLYHDYIDDELKSLISEYLKENSRNADITGFDLILKGRNFVKQ